MQRIFILTCLLFMFSCSQAQWVNIPDSNFGKWLAYKYPPSCIQGNPQVGFQMDTTSPIIISENFVDCLGQSISDLTGIEYFKNLTVLNCSKNMLRSLPPLSNSILVLDCSENGLSPDLGDLPDSLQSLDCSRNYLQTITGSWPPNLSNLTCTNNQIVSLNNLPQALQNIVCSDNQLHTIDSFPHHLISFDASINFLSSLPTLPSSLRVLRCIDNLLDSLPLLPDSLETLGVSKNHLVNISVVPALLLDLWFGSNSISQMPVLPNTLTSLDCSNNALAALPSHLPDSLKDLYCYGNSNTFTTLPALPPYLTSLDCSSSNITCLPKLPKSLYLFYFQSSSIQCMPNRINPQYFDLDPSTLPLCDITSGCPFYYNIEGNAHQKIAANCVADSISPGNGLHNIKVLLEEHNQIIQQVYTDNSGNYSFDLDSLASYTVKVDSAGLPFTIACPSAYSYTDSLTIYDSINRQKGFGLDCKGNSDFAVGYIVGSAFRPATTRTIGMGVGNLTKQYYNSNCGNGSSGTVVISFTGDATYVGPASYARTPTTISGNTFTYVVSNLDSVQYGDFDILIHIDTFATVNADICLTASIYPTLADINPANNTQTVCVPIRNSHDPNVKDVYPKRMTQAGGWLTYTIHFQNTGNDTAKTVVVKDTLPQLVQPETFSYLGSSHNPSIQIKANIVTFTFLPIDLVDSATNEALSHGWVQFKVKTKSNLPATFSIVNSAAIYFDLNSAIYTNDAITNTCTNTYGTIYDSICAGQSYVFASKNQTVGGVYYDTLSNVLGCDSFIDLHLFVKQKSTTHIFDSICSGSSKLFNGASLTQSGDYADTLTNAVGCDSIIHLHLYVKQKITAHIFDSICSGSSKLFDGKRLTQSGVYTDTLTNAVGCDSVITLTLTVKPTPVLPVIQRVGNSLVIHSVSGYTYQWKLNGQALSGQNDTTFAFTQNGNYTVEVTSPNQCTALSSVYTISNLGLSSLEADAVLLYPNPNSGQFTIQITESFVGGDIVVTDVLGQMVYRQTLNNLEDVISIEHPISGIYLVKLTKGGLSKTIRLMMQQR